MSNTPEYSVSELAFALKRTVEETYGRVRVRGELGRVTVAKSGHCYLDIKDDKAVINSIIWKGVMSRLPVAPEEGMEVICEGKLSTYPGRSNYQLIIDNLEPAGQGALMALFEKRKKMLAAEGLFAAERKRELPFLPKVIGVVTSPTGSVIRDILHRIEDRFPVHILVWPVLVQGDRAAEQITAAINGFNAIDPGYGVPRPDVIIVARGGGSLEDLWCFNEESVVRAAADSDIPLISAVGHETDWTLIDYVADYRAPTPTGAAEVAVPVRADYLETLSDYETRLRRGLTRLVADKANRLKAERLPRAETLLERSIQRLDLASAKFPTAQNLFMNYRERLSEISARLPQLTQITQGAQRQLSDLSARLTPALRMGLSRHRSALSSLRLSASGLTRQTAQAGERLSRMTDRMARAARQDLDRKSKQLSREAALLDAFSYQATLARGYALVSDESGAVVRDGAALSVNDAVSLTFARGVTRGAVITDSTPIKPKPKPRKTPKKTQKKKTDQSQMGLF
ncbi:exodeoxyribonuclease VII large subunit [Robiginitomaculum antarcticum]|uniref:exodeoxyribonuclease VII large subunit n=1 Tax=Robiginitomaculum antarcticum TaxID=437507 RepID=UPI00036B61B6|nr:exodeoxyribonuclease VII large subunit [Robiginitomaculum antarcticum]